MNTSVCVYMFAVINWIVGQKHKAVWIYNTHTNLDQFGITPKSNPLVFEFKGCSSAALVFRDTGYTWRYRVELDTSVTGKVKVALIMRNPSLVAVHEVYDHGKDCNTFIKMKIGWKNGIIAAWSYHVTGWNQFMIWNDTLPLWGNIKSLHTSKDYAFHWKIYVLEHSSSPYRVTCINI